MIYAIVKHHITGTRTIEYISQDVPAEAQPNLLISYYMDGNGDIWVEYAAALNEDTPLHPYQIEYLSLGNPDLDEVELITIHNTDDSGYTILPEVIAVIFSADTPIPAHYVNFDALVLTPADFAKVIETLPYLCATYDNSEEYLLDDISESFISVTFFDCDTTNLPLGVLVLMDESGLRNNSLTIRNIDHIEVHPAEEKTLCDVYTLVCKNGKRHTLSFTY